MFHPVDHPLERGWVGRVDGDRVVQLAAQTLQSFFTGGGAAREHAVYPLAAVRLLAPVLHPPAVRAFDERGAFEFRNPASIVGPDATVGTASTLELLPRLAAVVGVDGAIGGYTLCADWRRPEARPPKDRDFALATGPVVVTQDELDGAPSELVVRVGGEERARASLDAFDWDGARELALAGTRLFPGDLLVGPVAGPSVEVDSPRVVELAYPAIGTLRQLVGDAGRAA